MKYLTNTEIEAWLAKNGLPIDPYSNADDKRTYIQFQQPSSHSKKEAFAREFYRTVVCGNQALFHVFDWDHYTRAQMIAIEGIRLRDEEQRALIEAPARILDEGDEELGVVLLSLTSSFGWTSYLHCSEHQTTLLSWEGEFFDIWTSDLETLADSRELISRFELKEMKQNQSSHTTPAIAPR